MVKRAAFLASVLALMTSPSFALEDFARPEAMIAVQVVDYDHVMQPPPRGRRPVKKYSMTGHANVPLDIRTAPQIVAEAARYIGTRNPMHFRGPGCKVFVNMVARRTGYATNASARAFDTRGMGQRVAYPQPGDYRVSSRRGGGHVEIVASVDGGRVTTINGNKGRNRVGWSHRSIAGAAYYRPIRIASM